MAAARLGPKSLGDILDDTIRVYRAGFLIFLGTMAVLVVPLAILMVPAVLLGIASFAEGEDPNVAAVVAFVGVILVAALVFALGYLLAGGAATRVSADILLDAPTRVSRGYAAALGRFWALLGVAIVVGLAMLGLAVVCIPLSALFVVGWLAVPIGLILWFARPSARTTWLKWLIILTLPFGLVLYFGGLWSLSIQAVVLERLGTLAALRRSRALVQGHWWRAFGTVALVGILVSILQSIPQVLFSLLGTAVLVGTEGESFETLAFTQALSNLGSAVGWVLFGSVSFIATTVLYLDLRARKEAFDLELMARQLGSPGDASPS